MDPLSIAVGVLTVVQAGDRIIQLVSKIRLKFDVPEEVNSLINEVSDLRMVLNTMDVAASNIPREYLVALGKIIDSCNKIILELEGTLNSFSTTPPRRNISLQTQVQRVRWLKRKGKVEDLRQRLRDAKSTLILQILSINP
jgi:Fungal N-terminal domain of STAND proteins